MVKMKSKLALTIIIIHFYILVSSIQDDRHAVVFAAPGSHVVLPMEVTLRRNESDSGNCDTFYWKHETHSGIKMRTLSNMNNEMLHYQKNLHTTNHRMNYNISQNGSLEINAVNRRNDGKYTVKVFKPDFTKIYEKEFILHITGGSDETTIFTTKGSHILLPVESTVRRNNSLWRTCDLVLWIYDDVSYSYHAILRDNYCHTSYFSGYNDLYYYPFLNFVAYDISLNGSLELHHVTSNYAGRYTVEVYDSYGDPMYRHMFVICIQGKK
ncbi:uncharacterized protein LOC128651473 isoform X2 [Bombina bombina]|uniref:uncharacterized protein LOC128651473 isoform X2 n=1 Tax=Bombina bombina TaxID=8345 RepID=UPI00235ABA80|nr:uncharacterized protein LOC128651473 isoform X2 [Bombina bombina]